MAVDLFLAPNNGAQLCKFIYNYSLTKSDPNRLGNLLTQSVNDILKAGNLVLQLQNYFGK